MSQASSTSYVKSFGVQIGKHEGSQQALKSLKLVAAPAVQPELYKARRAALQRLPVHSIVFH